MKALTALLTAIALTSCNPAQATVDENCENYAEAAYLMSHYHNQGYPLIELHKFVRDRQGINEPQRTILGLYADELQTRSSLMTFEQIDRIYDNVYRGCLMLRRQGVW